MVDNSSCCQDKSCCCSEKTQKKEMKIDFLYLDLNVCERCRGTESNLDAAMNDVSTVLEAAGFDININKVNIITEDLAVKYKFLSSPTIRINDKDIVMEVKKSFLCNLCNLCNSYDSWLITRKFLNFPSFSIY